MPFVFAASPERIAWYRVLPPTLASVLLWVLWALAVFGTALFSLAGFPQFRGWTLIFSSVALAYSFFILYLRHGLGEPQVPYSLQEAILRARKGETVNSAPYFDFRTLQYFSPIGSSSLKELLRRLCASFEAQRIFLRLGTDVHETISALDRKAPQDSPSAFLDALSAAAVHAAKRGHRRIQFPDLFISCVRQSLAMRQFLFDRALSPEDIDAVTHWQDRVSHMRERQRRFWARENLLAVPPFGRSWAYGYTPLLDQFSIDLGMKLAMRREYISRIGYRSEIDALERALAKAANANVLLIGEPGVGVSDVVTGFVHRVVTGSSLGFLNYRRVLGTNLGGVVVGYRTTVEAEGRARRLLGEAAQAGGTILVLEGIDTVLGAETGGAAVDLTSTLLPFLEGSRLQIIATTTYRGLHEVVEKREALASLFERIEIQEPDATMALQLLLDAVPRLERRFGVFIPYPALKAAVTYADRTIQDVPFPKKAFDVLEDALIAAAGRRAKTLTPGAVARLVSERTSIPVGALTKAEETKLLNLEAFIHERIVDQTDAVRVLADALRRARVGLTESTRTRPMGTFLFLGPTGVGKTETAKALAEAYFGNEERMVRLNMSEFQGIDAIDRLVGSPATREEGRLTTQVRENPFSLVLLDEFEKATPNALNLFLQVFDEGRMEDGWGRPIAFTNTLIIATSNAGAEFIREYIQERREPAGLSDALREHVLREGIFRPELLSRFDAVVVYRPLGTEEVREIAKRILERLSATLMKERGITLVVESPALDVIVQQGFNQEFGARELRRALQNSVENIVAKKILEGAKRGDAITIAQEDLSSS